MIDADFRDNPYLRFHNLATRDHVAGMRKGGLKDAEIATVVKTHQISVIMAKVIFALKRRHDPALLPKNLRYHLFGRSLSAGPGHRHDGKIEKAPVIT